MKASRIHPHSNVGMYISSVYQATFVGGARHLTGCPALVLPVSLNSGRTSKSAGRLMAFAADTSVWSSIHITFKRKCENGGRSRVKPGDAANAAPVGCFGDRINTKSATDVELLDMRSVKGR